MEVNDIIVKSEGGTEQIYFFYVDENGVEQNLSANNIISHQVIQEAGVISEPITTSVDADLQEQLVNGNDVTIYYDNNQYISNISESWSEEEINRLLIFYIDNKATFLKGETKAEHIWDVACKTMLAGRTAIDCEMKFNELKRQYEDKDLIQDMRYLVLCQKAFYDEQSSPVEDVNSTVQKVNVDVVQETKDGIIMLKKPEKPRSPPDEKVVTMLNMYIRAMKDNKGVKKTVWQQKIWDDVAATIGTESSEYWHRKFLNFKQHYIRLLDKKNENGVESIHWPYIKYYEEIYKNDEDFIRKFVNTEPTKVHIEKVAHYANVEEIPWDVTEMTVLVKYYYDCYDDMLDPSLPKSFFWSEIGRLLDRSPESCQLKYDQMRKQHLENYNDGSYDVVNRVPLAILYDNIISRDVDLEVQNEMKHGINEEWMLEDIDKLAQFIYDNAEMYKDPICYNVCWCRLSRLLEKSIESCKAKWEELVTLYRNILNDKKNHPDQDIDWRYIDIFDRIFDYGMNETLLAGEHRQVYNPPKINEKIEIIEALEDEDEEEMSFKEELSDFDNASDDGNLLRERRKGGVEKAFKILEFYQKNKSIFNISNRNKTKVWQPVANEIKMSAAECAHRFRNLKQVYMSYLQRECKSPDKPILWPYYALCKKVFGYRALKSKIIKDGDIDYAIKEWSAKEIKALINYYSENYAFVNKNHNDNDSWTPLARQIKKTESACRDKFMEMRKSYRKLKAMMTRNPKVKISWKYYSKLDEICSRTDGGNDDEEEVRNQVKMEDDGTGEIQDDDDVQCIIVVPEGQTLEDAVRNANVTTVTLEVFLENNPIFFIFNPRRKRDDDVQCIIVVPEGQTLEDAVRNANVTTVQTDTKQADSTKKWTKLLKKRLLTHVLRHVKAHQGQRIDSIAMWKDIAEKIPNKTPVVCRRMYLRIKKRKLASTGDAKTPSYYAILNKILALEPKFFRKPKIVLEDEMKVEALEPVDIDMEYNIY